MQNSKQRAWLTPDTEDALAELLCRRFFVPDSPAFRESVSGALLELTHSWNWEQYGTMTPEETALVMLEMYNRYALDNACSPNETLTPFWDDTDAADSDDETDPVDQPWYEDVADWAVTAFLAASITPAAAIQFVTTARQIRFWFRKRDYGAIFRVLWDGDEIGTIDTYSATPDAGAFDYFAPSASEHTLRIEHTGTHNDYASPASGGGYAIEIVRGHLPYRPFGAQDVRYDDTTGEVQVGSDAGWNAAPELDPRNQAVPALGDGAQCDAAARMTALLQDIVGALISGLEQDKNDVALAWIVIGLLLFAGVFSLLYALALALAVLVVAAGVETTSTAFAGFDWTQLNCIFYFSLDGESQLTDAGIEQVKAHIASGVTDGTVANVLTAIVNLTGKTGLNAAAYLRTETGDCTACDTPTWCARLRPSTYDGWYFDHYYAKANTERASCAGVSGQVSTDDQWQLKTTPCGGTTCSLSVSFDLDIPVNSPITHLGMVQAGSGISVSAFFVDDLQVAINTSGAAVGAAVNLTGHHKITFTQYFGGPSAHKTLYIAFTGTGINPILASDNCTAPYP